MRTNQPASKRRETAEPDLQAQLAERFRELAALTVLLQEEEKASEAHRETIAWLCQVAKVLFAQPGWWGLMPKSWQAQRKRRFLRDKGLFDGDTYLRQNPDLAGADIDPLIHYLLHGLSEGRPRRF